MDARRMDRSDGLTPAVVAVIVAVVCTAAILLIDFGPAVAPLVVATRG